MAQFIVYGEDGYIRRIGICPSKDLKLQANEPGENVMVGAADDRIHKVVNGGIVEMTQVERDARKPTVIPVEKQQRQITKEEYNSLISRLEELEK